MLAATLLAAAAALPLGVWPTQAGSAAVVVHDIEIYLVEPEDDYAILAVQPLPSPLRKADPAELQRLVALATKLGADAVLLLGELPERSVPKDPDTPLSTTGRYSMAAFLSFDEAPGWDESRPMPSADRRRRARAVPHAAGSPNERVTSSGRLTFR